MTPRPDRSPHGLSTIEDLNWLGRLRLALRRQSRALYRRIRHPKNRRRGKVRAWLAEKIRNRNLWQPERQAVASGMAGGLFLSMLPIPLQSFVAAGVGIARGWNLPAAISATWISNPFTYLPMLLGAKFCITLAFSAFGQECAAGRLSMESIGRIWDAVSGLHIGEAWNLAGPALLEIAMGMVLLGVVLAALGWLIVQLSWEIFSPKKSSPPPGPPLAGKV